MTRGFWFAMHREQGSARNPRRGADVILNRRLQLQDGVYPPWGSTRCLCWVPLQ